MIIHLILWLRAWRMFYVWGWFILRTSCTTYHIRISGIANSNVFTSYISFSIHFNIRYVESLEVLNVLQVIAAMFEHDVQTSRR